MKKFIIFLSGLALLACLTRPALADRVDDLLNDEMKKHHMAGLALLVVQDGKTVKAQGYGLANVEWNAPATPDTVFEIGSMTKQFTAAAILLLQQDGKLSVDDPISKHLKNTPASWSGITIRHLLTHTSGLTNYTTIDGFELRQHLTQQQFIKILGQYPLSFQPGDSWRYCNSGFNLLGYIIENVSGKKYWDFLRERIFLPLDMTATCDRDPAIVIPHRATGYEQKSQKWINRDYDLTDIFAAGAIVSTVLDIAKWDAALEGDQMLNAASKEAWWTPVKLNNGKTKNYGFGWFLDPLNGHKNIGHSGSTSGFSATNQRFPDDHLTIILLTNAAEDGIATTLAKKVAPLYFADKNTPPLLKK